jgi:hypothetical protein
VGVANQCFARIRNRFHLAVAGIDVDSLLAEDLYQDLSL